MYRVIIADDEEPVLNSFSFIFRKDVPDFQICGLARSGIEAVTLIEQKSPDLVFMDIQMPGIDGLEAISRVRDRFPDTVFIIATAYERFDIAKKAIPLGVFSYMVKPISRKALLDKLDEVKAYLDNEKVKTNSKREAVRLLERTRNEKKDNFLSNLIFKNPSPDEWEEISSLFAIKGDSAAVYVIGTAGDIPEKIKKEAFRSIVIKLQYKVHCISGIIGDRLVILITEEKFGDRMNSHLEQILDEEKEVQLIFGAGNFYHFSRLSESFTQAFAPFGTSTEKRYNWMTELKRFRELCREILRGDKASGLNVFENFWIEIFNTDDFELAKGKMIAFFTLLIREINQPVLEDSRFNINIVKEITLMRTISEWKKWSTRAVYEILDILETRRASSYPVPLLKALNYIKGNYGRQIHLSSTAETCGISPSYLSRLFSEHMDTTFIDYLNRLRLNEAITLLREREISIKETSYLVGYQDPNYFSRIFKKYTGLAPSQLEKRRTADV